jgi:hypothetical protein
VTVGTASCSRNISRDQEYSRCFWRKSTKYYRKQTVLHVTTCRWITDFHARRSTTGMIHSVCSKPVWLGAKFRENSTAHSEGMWGDVAVNGTRGTASHANIGLPYSEDRPRNTTTYNAYTFSSGIWHNDHHYHDHIIIIVILPLVLLLLLKRWSSP